VSVINPTENCATFEASVAEIAVPAPPVFEGVSVYAPEPRFSMLKVPELPVVALRFCEPFADIRTPGIAIGF
jgi:hypothetical protein